MERKRRNKRPLKPSVTLLTGQWWRWLALSVAAMAMVLLLGVTMRRSNDGAEPSGNAVLTAGASPRTSALAFELTVPNEAVAPGSAPAGMVWIPGGEFSMGAAEPMGSDGNDVGMHATEDSRPIHRVYVDGFWMDRTEVTNAQFEAFVEATGYIAVAERVPTAAEVPGASPESLVARSAVFSPPGHSVPLDTHFRWWRYVKGASWRHPLGDDSSIKAKHDVPVVHVAYDDAVAYAKWVGSTIPPRSSISARTAGGFVRELAFHIRRAHGSSIVGTHRFEQRPMGVFEASAIRYLTPRVWGAAHVVWVAGGAAVLDGQQNAKARVNSRLGASLSFPVTRGQSVKRFCRERDHAFRQRLRQCLRCVSARMVRSTRCPPFWCVRDQGPVDGLIDRRQQSSRDRFQSNTRTPAVADRHRMPAGLARSRTTVSGTDPGD